MKLLLVWRYGNNIFHGITIKKKLWQDAMDKMSHLDRPSFPTCLRNTLCCELLQKLVLHWLQKPVEVENFTRSIYWVNDILKLLTYNLGLYYESCASQNLVCLVGSQTFRMVQEALKTKKTKPIKQTLNGAILDQPLQQFEQNRSVTILALDCP